MKILIDANVYHFSSVQKGEWKDTGVQLWGGKFPVQTGFVQSVTHAFPVRDANGGDQHRYLAALAIEFGLGNLEAHTTDLLEFEKYFHAIKSKSGAKMGDLSLMKGITAKRHDTMGNVWSSLGSNMLRSFSQDAEMKMTTVRDFLGTSTDIVFAETKEKVFGKRGDANSQDAWHLRCLISLELNYFLTTDFRLINAIKHMPSGELKHILLQKVKSPSDICNELKLSPLSDAQYEKFVTDKLGMRVNINR